MEADGKSDVFLKYFWQTDPLYADLKTIEHRERKQHHFNVCEEIVFHCLEIEALVFAVF